MAGARNIFFRSPSSSPSRTSSTAAQVGRRHNRGRSSRGGGGYPRPVTVTGEPPLGERIDTEVFRGQPIAPRPPSSYWHWCRRHHGSAHVRAAAAAAAAATAAVSLHCPHRDISPVTKSGGVTDSGQQRTRRARKTGTGAFVYVYAYASASRLATAAVAAVRSTAGGTPRRHEGRDGSGRRPCTVAGGNTQLQG